MCTIYLSSSIHSPGTLIGTFVHLLIHAIIQSASQVANAGQEHHRLVSETVDLLGFTHTTDGVYPGKETKTKKKKHPITGSSASGGV